VKQSLNIIGPQIRRLRNAMGWSQNYLAIKLQLLGMEHATRKKVAKIESREVWVSDDDMLFMSRVLRVDLNQLFPPKILGASHLYRAISEAKSSRYGC
jgi:transcriptional regulator with XRE-family HTH domain